MPKKLGSIEERLLANRWIDESRTYNGTPCWRWFGSKWGDYATISIDGIPTLVHRWIASKYLGLNLSDKRTQVCHHCDVKDCWNPGHLFLGSQATNVRDAGMKGLHHCSKKTHCPKGHPYEGDNLIVEQTRTGLTQRVCRTCRNERKVARRLLRKTVQPVNSFEETVN